MPLRFAQLGCPATFVPAKRVGSAPDKGPLVARPLHPENLHLLKERKYMVIKPFHFFLRKRTNRRKSFTQFDVLCFLIQISFLDNLE
jgi:hypothetical protein